MKKLSASLFVYFVNACILRWCACVWGVHNTISAVACRKKEKETEREKCLLKFEKKKTKTKQIQLKANGYVSKSNESKENKIKLFRTVPSSYVVCSLALSVFRFVVHFFFVLFGGKKCACSMLLFSFWEWKKDIQQESATRYLPADREGGGRECLQYLQLEVTHKNGLHAQAVRQRNSATGQLLLLPLLYSCLCCMIFKWCCVANC